MTTNYSPRKNQKIWNFIYAAIVLSLIAILLIIYNMTKVRVDDTTINKSSSSSISSVSSSSSSLNSSEISNAERSLDNEFEKAINPIVPKIKADFPTP